MKNIIVGLLLASVVAASADTNSTKAGMSYEFTMGGGGMTVDGNSEFGINLSLSVNPFKQIPNIWIGVAQGVAWEPKLGGTTDIFSDLGIPPNENSKEK